MDLMPIVPPIKEKGVWWGERDKRHAIIFWLVLTLGQAGQLISTEFSKPSWKNFDVLTTVFFFFFEKGRKRRKKIQEIKRSMDYPLSNQDSICLNLSRS